MIVPRSFIPRIRNISGKSYVENRNTFSVIFFDHAVYEILLKSTLEADRTQMTIWCMHVAYWITKATNTHSEYVILIAFPR